MNKILCNILINTFDFERLHFEEKTFLIKNASNLSHIFNLFFVKIVIQKLTCKV